MGLVAEIMGKQSMKRISQKNIAKKAGVSPSAVCLLLKDPNTKRVSPETRALIYEVMRENGYAFKSDVKSGDILCVYRPPPGALMSNRDVSFFYGSLLMAVEQTGQRLGHTVRLRSYNHVSELPALMRDPAVAGIISINSSRLAEEEDCGKPVIAVNAVYSSSCDTVQSSHRGSARDQIDLLCRYGHQRIAFFSVIYPPEQSESDREHHESVTERFSGYCEGLFQNNLPIRQEYCCVEMLPDFLSDVKDPVQRALAALFSLPEPPTAILAFNDRFAITLIRAAQAAGLRVPEDLSIVGNDNTEEGRHCLPALTTAEQNRVALGQVAVERLVQRIDNKDQGPFQMISIPLKVIERNSVSAPPTVIKRLK
jgi:DNA-binding LacI/PurR family transcriptional regulator